MNQPILIKNANIVNEGKIFKADIFIQNDIIEKIGQQLDITEKGVKILDAEGKFLFPGVIDAHVHFREPGLTHKGTIYTESKAAVAGGVTSFIDMPNTIPNVLTTKELETKFSIASEKSFTNYSFFMGVNNENIEQVLQMDISGLCGISDDGLYFSGKENLLADNSVRMEKLFSTCKAIIAIHSEKEEIIQRSELAFKQKYGENIPVKLHPLIRSEQACYEATKCAIEIAKKYNTRLHILHLSTEAETHLFQNDIPLNKKSITSEVSVHHLWFSDKDYEKSGTLIKCNPAIKTINDQKGLLQALLNDRIDIIATDHAPHTITEKCRPYFLSPSGIPMVQHSLVLMLELYHQGLISLEKIAEKMCHNVAVLYGIKKRGFIRQGYQADLTLVDLHSPWAVNKENILYKCGWSPLEGQSFQSKIIYTLVNGKIIYEKGEIHEVMNGQRLIFEKDEEQ